MAEVNDYDDYAESIAQSNASGTNRAHFYIEKPAMYKSLSDVKGKKILCVGCGTGEECAYLVSLGASVVGIDSSGKSIEIAKEKWPAIEFKVMDMHDLAYAESSFDIIYSSLTFHYSEHLDVVLNEAYRILKAEGTLIFSTLHPVKWASEVKRDSQDESKKSFILGYDSFTKPSQVFGDYLHVKSLIQKPEGYPVIQYWNRPISDYLRNIKQAGFGLEDFIEPSPIPELQDVDPDYWHTQSRIPQFMIFILSKSPRS